MSRLIASFLYVGLLRPAPGSWGSAAALPVAWALHSLGGFPALAVALVAAIGRHFGAQLPVLGGDAGLHLVLGLPSHLDDHEVARRVAQAGVASRPLSLYQLRRPATARGLVLGYGGVDEAEIARHFARLAQAVQSFL